MTERLDFRGLDRALRQVGGVLVFGVLPVVLLLLIVGWTYNSSTFLSDFHGDLYTAAKAILSGHDPYRVGFLAKLAAIARAGGHPTTNFAVPVYPAPGLLAVVPLALLPYRVAGIVFTGLGIGAFCLGLRLLGVRDWRCYGAAFLGWPMLHSLRLGQVNGFLVLGAAVAWLYRDRLLSPALAVAATVLAKVFLWPLGLFFLLTRRWRTFAVTVLVGAAILVAAWGVIGFDGLTAYPRLLSDLSTVEGTAGISLVSLGSALGLASWVSHLATLAVTGGLLWLAWISLRRPDGERQAFGLLVVAGLASSTLVWPHYLVLLYVPIALVAPTLGPLWLAPLAAYLAPVELTHGDVWKILPYLAIELWVIVALCAPLLGRRVAEAERQRKDPLGGPRVAVRLMHGLRSTSFRSHVAAQRPTRGPSGPY